jgi:hypothetical protein
MPVPTEIFEAKDLALQSEDGKELLIDADAFTALDEVQAIKPDALSFDSALGSGGAKGGLANFGAGLYQPVDTLLSTGIDNQLYFAGKSLINIGKISKSVAAPFVMSPISKFMGEMIDEFEIGDYLANAETALKIQKKEEARLTRLYDQGYSPESGAFQSGSAIGQALGFVATAAVAPEVLPVTLGLSSSGVAGEKTREYEEAGYGELVSYARGTASGVLNYAVEQLGVDFMTGWLKPLAKKTSGAIFARAISGAFGEGLEESAQEQTEQVLDNLFGMQEGFDFGKVFMAGVFGAIGGGIGGASYAQFARVKLDGALTQIADNLGVELTPEQRVAAVNEALMTPTFNATEYILNSAKVNQSVVDGIHTAYSRLKGLPEEAEGIKQEDLDRIVTRKRNIDNIIDSIIVKRTDAADEQSQETVARVKAVGEELSALINTYQHMKDARQEGDSTVKAIENQISTMFDDLGILEDSRLQLVQRLADETQDQTVRELRGVPEELKQGIQEIQDELKNKSKYLDQLFSRYSSAQIKADENLRGKAERLTIEYSDLLQERQEVLSGIKTNGKIQTTMAALRRARFKQISEQLKNIRKTAKATKQEIRAVNTALVNAVRRTRLPKARKDALIAKFKGVNDYNSLFKNYAAMQTVLDEALLEEKRMQSYRWLERGISKMSRSPFKEDQIFAVQLKTAMRGELPNKKYGDYRDAFLVQTQRAYEGNDMPIDFVLGLAKDMHMLAAQGQAKREALQKNILERQATLRAATLRGIKGLNVAEQSSDYYTFSDNQIKDGKRKFASLTSLPRNLNLISEEIAKLFDITQPYALKITNMRKAMSKFHDIYKKAIGTEDESKIAQMIDEDSDLENRTVELPFREWKEIEGSDGERTYTDRIARMTPAEARSLYATSRNSETARLLVKSQTVSEETLQALEEWINLPENARHKAIVVGHMAMLEEYVPRIQALYADVFPMAYFSPIDSYFMTSRLMNSDLDDLSVLDLLGQDPLNDGTYGDRSKKQWISMFQQRKGGAKKFRIRNDSEAMLNYIKTIEHFLAFGKYVNDLKTYFQNNDQLLTKTFGKGFMQGNEVLVNWLRDGARINNSLSGSDQLAVKAMRNTARALIKGVPQIFKQWSSQFAAKVDYTLLFEANSDVLSALRFNNYDILLAKESEDPLLSTILQTDLVQSRYGKSDEFDINAVSMDSPQAGSVKNLKQRDLNHRLSVNPRLGDQIAYLSVALAKARGLIKEGVNQTTAVAEGIKEAEASQASLNPVRANLELAKQAKEGVGLITQEAFTLSMTSMQLFDRYMTQVEGAGKKYKQGKKAEAIKDFGDILAKWHFWVPLFFTTAATGLVGDIAEYLKRIFLGPLGEVPFWGDIENAAYSMMTKIIDVSTPDKDFKVSAPFFSNKDLISSVIDSSTRSITQAIRAWQEEDDPTKALLELGEAAGFIYGMSTGFPAQELGKVSNNIYDNMIDSDAGLYPWMLTLSGYTKKRIDKAKEMVETE